MSYGMVPPPDQFNSSKRQLDERKIINTEKERKYNELTKGYTTTRSSAVASKRTIIENDYFENDSDEETDARRGDRRASGGARSERYSEKRKKTDEGEEEEDPLDAFMADINKVADQEKMDSQKKEEHAMKTGEYSGGQVGRDDIEQEDMHESMMKFMDEYSKRQAENDDDVYEYDEDGNIIWTWKKQIDPLPAVDHSTIRYKPFDKNCYEEHEEIAAMLPKDVFELRIALDIRVYGSDPPKPVVSFAHFGFDKLLMAMICKSEFTKPTPIQAQAIPAALGGRDVLGLAKTGSGKTLAFIWPAIVHIMSQEEISPGEGPIALVVVPTRELALQVYNEARRFAAPYNISVVCAYGGGSKYEQKKALEEGAELVVCTPGRIIDLVKIEATNFLRTTFLVFDEVDRMFDLGFEPQVKSISDHIRPDRQCLVFSATMKHKVEKLVVHALFNPVKVVCGDIGEANTDVLQMVLVLHDLQEKLNWLFANIVKFITSGKLLIFVTKKADAEELAKKVRLREIDFVLLHGDMHQQERNEKITAFRTKEACMIATDVAARGLDIPEIRNVVNFDAARDVETHIHRVGRTGRAGHQGFAYTLVTEKDSEFCAHLVKNFEASDQLVLPELLNVALKCPWFKAQHEKEHQGGRANVGATIGLPKQRAGLGFVPKQRPGFGLAAGAPSPLTGPSTSNLPQQPTIAKQVDRAKALVASGNVAGMDRVSMMRSALKSTFTHSFQRSTTAGSEYSLPASDPRPEWKIKLDEQTEKINKTILEQKGQSGDGSSAPRKRMRRWDT